MIAFIGVRMSWDMLNRNWLFARLPSIARIFSRSAASCFRRTRFCTYSITVSPAKMIAEATAPPQISVVLTSSTLFLAISVLAIHIREE